MYALTLEEFPHGMAWHGTYTNGYKKVPTLILEVVASKDLWIWHAFFGMAGTSNDITVLDRSPLFDDLVHEVLHHVIS